MVRKCIQIANKRSNQANTTNLGIPTACFPVTESLTNMNLSHSFNLIGLLFILLKKLTYSIVHIVVGSPIHVVTSPLEEALLSNAARLSVPRMIKFVFCFSKVGVIKLRSCRTLAHF